MAGSRLASTDRAPHEHMQLDMPSDVAGTPGMKDARTQRFAWSLVVIDAIGEDGTLKLAHARVGGVDGRQTVNRAEARALLEFCRVLPVSMGSCELALHHGQSIVTD